MAVYHKGRRINSGGFGVVYEATSSESNQPVAYKELTDDAMDQEGKQRFIREVKIQAKLNHPNIVQILNFNLSDEAPWFVMPLARTNLRAELRHLMGNRERIIEVFLQILSGVEYAHKNGVIHRDLKPENILLFEQATEGEVKIADFGLGKRMDAESMMITRTNAYGGTEAYMAPEQETDFRDADHRSDIFALGKIFFEMFTGREYPRYVNIKHPNIPSGYGFIIGKCIENDPAQRYESVEKLRDDILLLAAPPKKFGKPIDRAKEILSELKDEWAHHSPLVKELEQLINANENDEALLTEVLAYLPRRAIEIYIKDFKHQFYHRLRRFDQIVSGQSLDFAYTDVVADFYERVFSQTSEDSIKQILLSRVIDMGHTYTRWHVRSVAVGMLQSITTDSEALLARDVMQKDPHGTLYCAAECEEGKVLPIVSGAFEWCRNKIKADERRRLDGGTESGSPPVWL